MRPSTIKIFLSILVLIITATLLYFKIYLNSDSLFLEALSTDLFFHGGAWVDWKLSPAPAYLPDMLLYFIAYPLLPNAIWRIFYVSISQVFILAATVVWCARKISPQISRNATSILILLVAAITLVAANSSMWLYFYTTNNHFAALSFSLLSLGLYIKFFEEQKKWTVVMLLFLGVSAQLSTAVYFISFTLPAFMMLGGMFIFCLVAEDRKNKIILAKMISILIAAYGLAALLQPIITYHNPLHGRIGFSWERTLISVHAVIIATKNAFAFDNYYTAILSYSVILSFLFTVYRALSYICFKMQMKLTNKQLLVNCRASARGDYADHKITLVALFFIITISLNTIGAILSGGFVDPYGFRYITFPIAMSLIITTVTLNKSYFNSTVIVNILYFALLALILISSINFIQLHKKLSPVAQKSNVASCLKSIENKGFILQAGIADYWNAKGVSYLFQKEKPILATMNDLKPFFWMSTIGPLKRPGHYPEYKYNFVITQDINGSQFQYTPDILRKILPPPDKIEFCSDTEKTQIWFYKSDALDVQMKSVIHGFLEKKAL